MRLHDTDRRGWWIFITLIPFIGGIILLVFDVLPGQIGQIGQIGQNRFGPDSKAATPQGTPDLG